MKYEDYKKNKGGPERRSRMKPGKKNRDVGRDNNKGNRRKKNFANNSGKDGKNNNPNYEYEKTDLPNALSERKGKSVFLFTKNLVPGFTNYDEDLIAIKGSEYRTWNATKSKLAAAIAKGMRIIGLKEDTSVLYLGAASGTTVSHVSDIFSKGMIFAVEFSREPYLDLLSLSEKRSNIVPIFEDANNIMELSQYVPYADFIFMDVAQKNQVEILEKNSNFADSDSLIMIAVKARSINVVESPREVFEKVRKELSSKFKILQEVSLEPYEKDHRAFLLKKKF